MNALGFYLLISLLFVFGSMVEFAAVLFYRQKIDQSNRSKTSMDKKSGRIHRKIGIEWPTNDGMDPEEVLVATSKIDWMAFVVFIAFYSIFNFIYFCVTLTIKWCNKIKTSGCLSWIKFLIANDWLIFNTLIRTVYSTSNAILFKLWFLEDLMPSQSSTLVMLS